MLLELTGLRNDTMLFLGLRGRWKCEVCGMVSLAEPKALRGPGDLRGGPQWASRFP